MAARLGYAPFRADAERFIEARISKSEGGALVGTVDMSDARGESVGKRRLESASGDCAELIEAMVLAISLAIDPMSFTRPPPAKTATVAAQKPKPSAPLAPVVEADKEDAGSSASVTLAVGPVGSVGTAPNPSVGLWLGGAARWPSFSLGLEGRADLPTTLDLGQDRGVSVSLITASLLPCYRIDPVAACFVMAAGAHFASGEALDESRSITAAYYGLGARLALLVGLSEHFALEPRAEALAAVTQTSLLVSQQEVWTTPRLSFSLGLGLVYRINE